jgi:hypothetical protein
MILFDKKFKETLYCVVLDPCSINWLKPNVSRNIDLVAHLDKPIGAMLF